MPLQAAQSVARQVNCPESATDGTRKIDSSTVSVLQARKLLVLSLRLKAS